MSGERSASGKPLLANDPHLGLSAPALWYFAHLSAPGLNVIGATLPGIPTDIDLAPDGRSFALSNNIALPIGAVEHYILATGAAGACDPRGWETDLLAGLDLQ